MPVCQKSRYWYTVVAMCMSIALGVAPVRAGDAKIDFDRDIRPLLTQKCLTCHGPDAATREADLRLDLEASAKASRDELAAVVPGEPERSGLVQRITSADDDLRMPPADSGLTLSENEIALLRRWIAKGADYQPPWAFTPVERPALPSVKQTDWPTSDIDRFILARLEEEGLRPAPDADRRTFIRRLSFDLIGLPPSPNEVEAFVSDESPDAHAKVVDHLLASKHFGERWARHWLDLVRYAETYGYEHDWPIPLAWRYRDYVIRMFNEDVPYDQVVREHVAGDLLKNPRRHRIEKYNESIIGTGFWYLHGQMSQPVDVKLHEADRFDNQIDVFSRAFLGLTVACARCHDHKFDPISTEDYYGLLGFLRSSRRQETYLDSGGQIAATVEQLTKLQDEADAIFAQTLSASADTATIDRRATHEQLDNLEAAVLFEDFASGSYDDWFVSGKAFGLAPTQSRQWDRTSRWPAAVRPGLAHSGLLAGRLLGTLQSREFPITHSRIWLRVAGQGTIRIIINGYMMQRYKDQLFRGTEIKVDIPHDSPKWVELAGDIHLYRGHTAYLEIIDNSGAFIEVDEIHFANEPPPKSPSIRSTPARPQPEADARLAELTTRMATLDRNLPLPKRAMTIGEGDPLNARVNIRGNVDQVGPLVPRKLPEIFRGDQSRPTNAAGGSGRLAMAEQLLADSNPLLARVRVNWVWHHLFGRGIVPTVDNFGSLGDAPTHPELLDYLAGRFRSSHPASSSLSAGFDWSIKKLIREVVLSRAYRMSSRATDEGAERLDPTNAWLHRMRVRRLQGEAIRDAMLTVSGQLDDAQFGPAVPVHLTPFMQGLSRPEKSGPLDGNRRRSIYLEVRRNFLPPMFVTFDSPIPTTCVARRSISNVPAQALVLMNDPLVAQQAKIWAERVMGEASAAKVRLEKFYLAALSRRPRAAEVARAERFLTEQAQAYGISAAEAVDDVPLWSDLAHALFGVKEFIFIR